MENALYCLVKETLFVPPIRSNKSSFVPFLFNGEWFEPRSLSRLFGLIVRVRVVLRRTVVGDIDRRFDNLSGSHQSFSF